MEGETMSNLWSSCKWKAESGLQWKYNDAVIFNGSYCLSKICVIVIYAHSANQWISENCIMEYYYTDYIKKKKGEKKSLDPDFFFQIPFLIPDQSMC